MRRKTTGFTVLVTSVLLLGASTVWGQDKSKGQGTGMPDSAQMAAMMARMMKIATPGPQHQMLAKLAGKWNFTMRMYMGGPGAPPSESNGTCDMQSLLGGRYLVQNAKGMVNGMPFEGMGINGYDNDMQKYVATWMDNMGTMIMTGTGTADSTGKIITFTYIYDDPMTGEKAKKSRQVLRIISNDELAYDMYDNQGGQEFKVGEIAYKRAM
jgi:hypothetical protein